MEGRLVGRSLTSHRLSGDPGLRDVCILSRVRANAGSVFVTVTATMGIHVGVFKATGERQWLTIPMGESWTPSLADPTSRQCQPTCPFYSVTQPVCGRAWTRNWGLPTWPWGPSEW